MFESAVSSNFKRGQHCGPPISVLSRLRATSAIWDAKIHSRYLSKSNVNSPNIIVLDPVA